jgi:hypothetical protein
MLDIPWRLEEDGRQYVLIAVAGDYSAPPITV